MNHRHLDTNMWTLAAIDSALEYGRLVDWRRLMLDARHDRSLAERVLTVSRAHGIDGSSALAEYLILRLWPDLSPDRVTS